MKAEAQVRSAGKRRRVGGLRIRRSLTALLASAAAAASAVPALSAEPGSPDRVVGNPPLLPIHRGEAPRATAPGGPLSVARNSGEKRLDLDVVYSESRIYNPASGVKDRVRLRSYGGAAADGARPYVAPTIEVFPGDTVRVTLRNRLPVDPSCADGHASPNVPHCFNSTNLHTHGLWVSPAGNSDNVLLSIDPGQSFQFEYNIPPDHPAGTFWYHPHRHGSTALQVSSGMAGALIIRGDRLPTRDANGDLDTLLRGGDGRPLPERVLVLQQIQYACLDAEGRIRVERNAEGEVTAWTCGPDDVGGIEFYVDPAGQQQFGFESWSQSGRYTSINGVVLPVLRAEAGRIERWRLIHAGVRDSIALELRRLKPGAPSFDRLKPVDSVRYIDENCSGEPLPYHLVASDGLTMAAARPTTRTVLHPGYRNDALMIFPEAGRWCVINAAIPPEAGIARKAPSRRLLGVVEVAPGRAAPDVSRRLQSDLVAAARREMPKAVREQVIADLRDGLKLTKFTPLPDIPDDAVTGRQELTFFIDTAASPPSLQVDGRPYDPARIDRVLPLGGTEEWTLRSGFIGHPFHIHVNPFQIVRILDPAGRDVSAPGAIDDAGGAPDPQYPGLKGVWKDTLLVKSLIPPRSGPDGLYTVVLRTRYERYIGDFVLHCHILDHEDMGMMQNIRIALPEAVGAHGEAPGRH